MLILTKIAITGGIASGKSTVCQLFQKLGANVVSADAIAHELLNPQTNLGRQVIQTLGTDILQNGKIDRTLVARKVFKDPKLLRALEQLLHPEVLTEIRKRYETACKTKNGTLFVVEIPLLFEVGAERFFDYVIAVTADEAIAKKRFEAAGFEPEEYERRMNRQIPQSIKSGNAHYTINNNGTLNDLEAQVKKVYANLTKAR